MNINEKLSKLPKWAQDKIMYLERDLKSLQAEINRRDENTESNTVVGNLYSIDKKPAVYLRNNQEITFILSAGEIRAMIKGDDLNIMAHEGDLTIKPQVSNSILLRLK